MNYEIYSPAYNYLIAEGWTKSEIEKYIPILQSLDADSLMYLHEIMGLEGYISEEQIEDHRDTAVWALVNPKVTPKEILLEGIRKVHRRMKLSAKENESINVELPVSE